MESTTTPPSGDEGAVTRRRKERHRAVPLLPEVRHFAATGLEVRSAAISNEIVVSGSPIVYDRWYQVVDMFGPFQERMSRGVASEVLPTADVRFQFDHSGLPLARTLARTMALSDTPDALTFEARLDARQQLANDLAIAIERGDITQMSCGFIVAEDDWDDAMENRTIIRFADLLDVSAVTYPASPTTSIQVAQRMLMEVPVESRARVRKMYADIRAGKVLSAGNQDRVKTALEALHELATAGDVDLADIKDAEGDTSKDASADAVAPDDGNAAGSSDASGTRAVEDDTEETRTDDQPVAKPSSLARATREWLDARDRQRKR